MDSELNINYNMDCPYPWFRSLLRVYIKITSWYSYLTILRDFKLLLFSTVQHVT